MPDIAVVQFNSNKESWHLTQKFLLQFKLFFWGFPTAGVPAVLKFLKFQKCPEIVLKFYSFGKNVLKMAFDAR